MRETTGAILVVDDDPINRMLLVRSLERDGHTVPAAENGREALELLARNPRTSSCSTSSCRSSTASRCSRRSRPTPGLRHIPVIMISAVDEVDSVIGCIELGADDYLAKPFDPVLLRARINAGLAKKRLHDLERERVRDVFARFVPEQIVDQVISLGGADLRLGGVLCTGTILFNDIRNFTPFAEATPADQALEVLNLIPGRDERCHPRPRRQPSRLSRRRHDGGVRGADRDPRPRRSRVAAAREMLEVRLPRAERDAFDDQGLSDGFRMGVGLASGPFMAGNVGSAAPARIHGDRRRGEHGRPAGGDDQGTALLDPDRRLDA